MSLQHKHSRMVSFRLSDEQYSQLRSVCEAHGGRSFSEIARVALDALLQSDLLASRDELGPKVADIDRRVAALHRRVDALQMLVAPNGTQREP